MVINHDSFVKINELLALSYRSLKREFLDTPYTITHPYPCRCYMQRGGNGGGTLGMVIRNSSHSSGLSINHL